jgi:hypothetical protein
MTARFKLHSYECTIRTVVVAGGAPYSVQIRITTYNFLPRTILFQGKKYASKQVSSTYLPPLHKTIPHDLANNQRMSDWISGRIIGSKVPTSTAPHTLCVEPHNRVYERQPPTIRPQHKSLHKQRTCSMSSTRATQTNSQRKPNTPKSKPDTSYRSRQEILL